MTTTFAVVGTVAPAGTGVSLIDVSLEVRSPQRRPVIYHHHITPTATLSERAYADLRRMIVRLDLAPGTVLREESLQETLGLGRTPIREALQRLARDQFVTVISRRGMYVSSVDVDDLALLYETRAILEPYAMRLASARGTDAMWDDMAAVLEQAQPTSSPVELLDIVAFLAGGVFFQQFVELVEFVVVECVCLFVHLFSSQSCC
ncbi:MAG: GntR family transcriptional regulator [Actinomycetota bacterium]|nr:GntR family transcriptional regulator [Actinomycetota bacterium]